MAASPAWPQVTPSAADGTPLYATLADQTLLTTEIGAVTETAPANDTASSGLNGRLQRIAQNITTLIAATLKVNFLGNSGVSTYNYLQAANTTPVQIKSGAGRLLGMAIFNQNASARFLKLWDKATSPTVGTDVPTFEIGLVASALNGSNGNGLATHGFAFTNGLWVAVTTAAAHTDNTAPSANDCYGPIIYT